MEAHYQAAREAGVEGKDLLKVLKIGEKVQQVPPRKLQGFLIQVRSEADADS